MRAMKGIVAASFLAALVGTISMGILSPEVSATQFVGVVFIYTLVGSLFAICCALLFDWPLSLIYSRLGLASWWQFCIGGAICALPFWIGWFYPFDTGHWEAYRVSNSLYFLSVGVLGGYFYWWLVVRPQPTNKSSKKDALTRASS